MTLIEAYPTLRHAHIVLVTLSGTLFALRAAGVLAGARWPLTPGPRFAAMGIDTLLLAAGVTLWITLGLNPLRETWLGAKLVLLVVYVGLGTMALRRARGTGTRLAWTAAALACFGAMVAIARTHDAFAGLVPR
ncbi:SirB2 family protein [Azohydromonas sediminis]|uniref:SirB2 family protein n=1 Tax=Azohydromonas sediminis TaxID=2259674 RepID=UPI000E656CA9|nr:SirB2 family protein [Azohydromonas sediminis]